MMKRYLQLHNFKYNEKTTYQIIILFQNGTNITDISNTITFQLGKKQFMICKSLKKTVFLDQSQDMS